MQSSIKGGTRTLFYSTNSSQPFISIIIVTLNASAHIEQCLLSIIQQPYQNIEILIFDGGSSDTTLNILERYDKQITFWQSQPDRGVYDAMNKAVKAAKGDWVYFLGADDKLLSGFAQMASKLEDRHTVYYGDMSYDGEETSRKKYSAYRLAKETICHQAIIYPRSVFDEYQYDLNYPLAADWNLNLRLWADERYTFRFYPYLIADFSMSGISTQGKDHNFLQDQPRIIKETLGWPVYLRYRLKQLKRKLKNVSH